MSIERDHATHLRRTFQQVMQNSDVFCADIYEHLFTTHPETQALFKQTDMNKLREKMLLALVMIVENATEPIHMEGTLHDLGNLHLQRYSVEPKHFSMMRDAIFVALEKHLGDDWTPATEAAWRAGFAQTVALMLSK